MVGMGLCELDLGLPSVLGLPLRQAVQCFPLSGIGVQTGQVCCCGQGQSLP